jgi:hypothetical protein
MPDSLKRLFEGLFLASSLAIASQLGLGGNRLPGMGLQL